MNTTILSVEFPDGVDFHCARCGACCKAHPSEVNAEEQAKIEALGYVDFLEGNSGDITRRIKAREDGGCFFLAGDNSCTIYTVRPVACILEPLMITDYDYEQNTIKLDISPAALFDPSLSCKGLFCTGKLPIEDMAKAARTTVEECLRFFARAKGLPMTSKEVASLSRQHFLQVYKTTSEIAEILNSLF